MGLIPHYVQSGHAPAVTGKGFGFFACPCGQSLLISGYEPRNFIGIAIQCAACAKIAQTPGLPLGALPPPSMTLLERGTPNPPSSVDTGTILISREEMERAEAAYQPRRTETDVHALSEPLLNDIDFQQRRWTDVPLDPDPAGYREQSLAWAVAHFRTRLQEPGWTTFADDTDIVAMTVIAAFRDLFGSWVHHPLFGTIARTVAADNFSLHAMAMLSVAKALILSGNRLSFRVTEGPRNRIVAPELMMAGQAPVSVAVNRFDQFEWPNCARATQPAVQAQVLEAMGSVRGRINRVHPGILVLSAGASDARVERFLADSVNAALRSHGKRHRGLSMVAITIPKIGLTGQPGEVRFGYTFQPFPNRQDASGPPVMIGSRADHAGFGEGTAHTQSRSG